MEDQVPALLKAALEERTEWDEEPMMYVICSCGDEGSLHMHATPAPDWFWQQNRPPVMVMRLAQGMERHPELLRMLASDLPPAEVFAGIAFRCEGWTVALEDKSPADTERLKRALTEHELCQQPERIGCRNIWACDTHGELYAATQNRGGGVTAMHLDDSMDPQGTVLEGIVRLTLAMRTLLEGD